MVYQDLLQEVSKREKQRFAAQIYRLIRQTGKLEQEKVEAMGELLKRVRADVSQRIVGLPKGNFTREMGRALKADVDRVMAQFAARASRDMRINQDEFARMAGKFTYDATAAAGAKPPMLGIAPELVENAATRSADLIRTLSAGQIGRASDVINRGVISGLSTFEVAQQLSDTFDKGIAQMETIARTEMLGIHSQVQFAQMQDMERTTPGLKKQWIAVQDNRTRLSHLLPYDEGGAHLQSVPIDQPFKVPITVGSGKNQSLGPVEELMFPRDPSGSPGNIISCRCTMVSDFSEAEGVPAEAAELTLTESVMPPVPAPTIIIADLRTLQRKRKSVLR